MIPRQIIGPQEQFERTGAQSLRDIRPFTTRLSEALRSSGSGIILGMAAVGTFFEPAVVDLAVPAALLYAWWVLTRRVKLPMRLPRTAALPDYSNPTPGSRKAKMAAGSLFIGWSITGQELWATPEDARQHMTIPGTTGAGKTTAILSLLASALAQGSGFVLVDGKADRDLFGKVLALARRFGREDDVRVLNFMVASGLKDSNTFNCFATGNADALREMLASQMGEQTQNDTNGVFRDRAVALIGTIAPVLVWLRDHKGVLLNIEVIRSAIYLRWIWKLAMQKIVLLRNAETGIETEIDVKDEIPEELIGPLKDYLGELPGYDPTVPLDKQKGDEPSKQHGYAQFYFTATFTQLVVSLGHIFKVESGDIDMRDVVLNRRILVVNLPALENSDATLAALGKLVVASLRGMMAQLLGASLEGDYTAADKPGMGPSPFPIVLDELAYYATSGLDRMLAMGRGLNISFVLGFQEVSGIWARLGEKTASLLGNANLTIAMRQQDSGRTREWIEKTAGQTNVTQATSYQGASDGNYREARHAEVRSVSRVDWNDLTSLIEGEAIVLFGSRRIYARLFHAEIDDTGPKRLGRSLMLPPPNPETLRARLDRIGTIAARIERGSVLAGGEEALSPALAALLRGFARAARDGDNPRACARGALAAISSLPENQLPVRPPPPADGTPVTGVMPMLATASQEAFAGPQTGGLPHEPVDGNLLRGIAAIQHAAGVPAASCRDVALSILADRDEALEAIAAIEPPPMPPEVFRQHLTAVIEQLGALRATARVKRAA
ncbi:MAG: type IV secretion system DNA-binding domain-containing protein [Alphaproteobacteria bacterium]|nr:type IV secretion system DNA-binding domain-containing protein [Alphaproteobacteria bacterium]